MNTGKLILGVLAGAAAGTILGILFAPDKGSETRKKIAKKSKKYAGAVKDKFVGLMEDVSEKVGQMKEDFNESHAESKETDRK